MKAEDPDLQAIRSRVAEADPDVLILTDFDYDLDGLAMAAFADLFAGRYPHQFALMPNAGMATGLDVDRDGRTGDARDAQGYGRFAGDGGIAILSQFAIGVGSVQDFSTLLWRDLPDAVLPSSETGDFLPPEVTEILRLSSSGHWIVPIRLPDGGNVSILAFAATPPVFDGPEDMNGLRARDELRLWENVLDGHMGPIPRDFVVAGLSNLDPIGGQGDQMAMAQFLRRPDLIDPHSGTFNADWGTESAGKLRVSYVLPATSWEVVDAGTILPAQENSDGAGPHGLVWVDLRR